MEININNYININRMKKNGFFMMIKELIIFKYKEIKLIMDGKENMEIEDGDILLKINFFIKKKRRKRKEQIRTFT